MRVTRCSSLGWHSPGDVVNVDLRFSPPLTCRVRNFCTERDEYLQYISRRMHTRRRRSRVSKDISQRRAAEPQPRWGGGELREWAASAFGTPEHRRGGSGGKKSEKEKESARGSLETRSRGFCIKLTLEERGWHPPGTRSGEREGGGEKEGKSFRASWT